MSSGTLTSRTDRSSTGFKQAATLAAIVAWTLVIVLAWAIQPMSHTQITGYIELDDGGFERVLETTRCNSLFDGEPRDLSEPLPEFEFGFDFSRTPCEQLHADSRLLLAVNAMAIVAMFAGWIAWFVRSRRRT